MHKLRLKKQKREVLIKTILKMTHTVSCCAHDTNSIWCIWKDIKRQAECKPHAVQQICKAKRSSVHYWRHQSWLSLFNEEANYPNSLSSSPLCVPALAVEVLRKGLRDVRLPRRDHMQRLVTSRWLLCRSAAAGDSTDCDSSCSLSFLPTRLSLHAASGTACRMHDVRTGVRHRGKRIIWRLLGDGTENIGCLMQHRWGANSSKLALRVQSNSHFKQQMFTKTKKTCIIVLSNLNYKNLQAFQLQTVVESVKCPLGCVIPPEVFSKCPVLSL